MQLVRAMIEEKVKINNSAHERFPFWINIAGNLCKVK